MKPVSVIVILLSCMVFALVDYFVSSPFHFIFGFIAGIITSLLYDMVDE